MYKEINTTDELRGILVKGETLKKFAFQDVDFYLLSDELLDYEYANTYLNVDKAWKEMQDLIC
mgnify:CR=1 FL=1